MRRARPFRQRLWAVVSEQAYMPYLIALAFAGPLAFFWFMLEQFLYTPQPLVRTTILGGALLALAACLLMFGLLKPALKRAVRHNLGARGLLAQVADTRSADLPRALQYMLRASHLELTTADHDLCHRLRALIANYTQLCQHYRQWPVPRRLALVLRAASMVFCVLIGAIGLMPIVGIAAPPYQHGNWFSEIYLTVAALVCIPLAILLGWLFLLYRSILKRSVAEVIWEILG